jgi:hypothetical protein
MLPFLLAMLDAIGSGYPVISSSRVRQSRPPSATDIGAASNSKRKHLCVAKDGVGKNIDGGGASKGWPDLLTLPSEESHSLNPTCCE